MKIKIKGKEYEVEILEAKENEVKIKVGGKEFTFGERENALQAPTTQTSFPKRDFSKKEIKAPISGIITGIFVKEGDFIEKGRKVVLLSAMKMENEIISEFKGKIKKILVSKKQKVKEGEILIILE